MLCGPAENGTEPALPLTGYTVAVTAARRREELQSLLERRGARVISAPAIQLVPLSDDTELLRATRECIAAPPDVVVATTGVGFRGWVEAADGWGIGEQLLTALGTAEVLARGPKARGAVRTAGLEDTWSPPSESSSGVLEHLLRRDLAAVRVAVQLHGEPLPDFLEALRGAGAEVVEVPVYRWTLPPDVAPLERLVDLIAARGLDAVVFTSAPAAASLLSVAQARGRFSEVVDALREAVVPACVGPVTAGPLERLGVPTVQPVRSRIGALVREVVAEVPQRRCRRFLVAGRLLELRGHAATVDGRLVELAPAPFSLLRALADQPGRVVPRQALLQALPGGSRDEHAVEMAVTRLRTGLGDPRLVQTVIKRGYRLPGERW